MLSVKHLLQGILRTATLAFVVSVKQAGRKGGNARAAKMTPEERSESARQAALARFAALSPEERSAVASRAGKAGGRGRGKKKEGEQQ